MATDGRDKRRTDDWRWILTHGINSAADAARETGGDAAALSRVEEAFPVRVNSYYSSLIRNEANDALGRQVYPSAEELSGGDGVDDPLGEEADSPVPHLVHRYPDRVLLLVTYQCAVYCRFCTRRRAVGRATAPTDQELEKAAGYIRDHAGIRDVIVSGGDPLLLSDDRLSRVLSMIRGIPHVEILRVDTRAPCTLPQRVTEDLCAMLARHHPLFVNTHFNHPREVTAEAREACARLVDHGIPVGNQTVLLRGVNDDPAVIKELMQKLLTMRVRPYYLYQCDPVSGADHFRTGVDAGLRIMAALRGHTSGLAVPTYVIDAPGGGGKVPLLPEGVVELNEERVVVRNHEGRRFTYTQAPSAALLK